LKSSVAGEGSQDGKVGSPRGGAREKAPQRKGTSGIVQEVGKVGEASDRKTSKPAVKEVKAESQVGGKASNSIKEKTLTNDEKTPTETREEEGGNVKNSDQQSDK